MDLRHGQGTKRSPPSDQAGRDPGANYRNVRRLRPGNLVILPEELAWDFLCSARGIRKPVLSWKYRCRKQKLFH